MIVRNAQKDDVEDIKRLLNEQHAFHVNMSPTIFRFNPIDTATILEIIENPKKNYLVAEEEGAIIGMIQLEQKATNHPVIVEKRYVYIQEMFIEESFRRKGVGSQLLKEAKNWARNHGIQYMRTSVLPHNHQAISFYKKEGFDSYMLNLEMEIAP